MLATAVHSSNNVFAFLMCIIITFGSTFMNNLLPYLSHLQISKLFHISRTPEQSKTSVYWDTTNKSECLVQEVIYHQRWGSGVTSTHQLYTVISLYCIVKQVLKISWNVRIFLGYSLLMFLQDSELVLKLNGQYVSF